MLEDVLGLALDRGGGTGGDEPATLEAPERLVNGLVSHEATHGLLPEDPADDGGLLEHPLFAWWEGVDPGREEAQDGVGKHEAGRPLGRRPPLAGADQDALVDEPSKHLFQEERVAFNSRDNLVPQAGRDIGHGQQLFQQPMALIV